MKTKHHVVVTEKDCIEGCRGTERYCVVALAMMRLIPEATRIEINVDWIRFSVKEGTRSLRCSYATPEAVRDYIRAYDAGAEPEPFEFDLDNPQVVEKAPRPKLQARTPSLRPQGAASTRRSVRVFGEKAFVPNRENA